ncbi:hypothetical protein M2427_005618 [Bradyrhizobium sp. BR13661]|jgi:hypothetical protein|nr:hypothetical protein [Bradyrhizobium sp. BR13661]
MFLGGSQVGAANYNEKLRQALYLTKHEKLSFGHPLVSGLSYWDRTDRLAQISCAACGSSGKSIEGQCTTDRSNASSQ